MTRILYVMAFAVVLMAGPVHAFAAAPDALPRAQWARFDTPPGIDGRLDDPCWKQATHIARFRLLENGEEPKEPTEAFLGYDGTSLYFAFRMRQEGLNPDLPLGPQVAAVITERDGKINQDDSIEIYLNPVDTPEALHTYYRFGANALATQADQYGKDPAWDADWQVRTAHEKNYWTMEIAIPLYNFHDSVGRTTKSWRLNMFRTNSGKKEYSAWSPSYARSYHVPERFGITAAPKVNLDKFAYFAVTSLTFHDYNPEKGTLQARLAVQNNTDQPREAKVTLSVTPDAGQTRSVDKVVQVPARQSVEVTAPVELEGAGLMRMDVFVRDPKTREVIAFAPPMSFQAPNVVSLQPGLSYYTAEKTAEIQVRLGLGESVLKGTQTAVTLQNDGGVLWQDRAPSHPLHSFNIPIVDLPVGLYRVEANLVRDNKVLGRDTCELVRRQGSSNEVKFNAQMGAVVDGKPFFPYGITHVPEPALAEVAKMGFNCVTVQETSQQRLNWDKARFQSYLDAAHTNGLKVILGLFHAGSDFKATFRTAFPKYMAGLPELKDHPSLLAWYTVGEPVMSERDETVQLHNALKVMDPYHPTFPIFCITINFTDGWDIGCVDTYWRTDSQRPLYVPQLVDAARRITMTQKRPFWIVPQAGLWSGAIRELTPQEQRCQTYLALIHGVNGIIYFKYKPLYEPLWEEFGRLAGEVKRLTPILLTSESAGSVSVQPVADKFCNIHWLFRKKDDRYFLLAVNAENTPVAVRFSLPETVKAAQVSEFFENRNISFKSDGRFDDNFDGYGTHVYEICGQQ